MLKKSWFLLLAVLFVTLAGCGGEQAQQDGTSAGETAALINGEEISMDEYKSSLEQVKASYQQQGIDFETKEGKQYLAEIEKQTIDQLIGTKLLLQEADKKGYTTPDEEVNEYIKNIKEQYESEEQFEQILKDNNLTLEQLKEEITKEFKIQQYLENDIEEPSVSEEEIMASYEQYSEQVEDAPEYEEIKEQLKQQLQNQKTNEMIIEKVEQLKEESDIEILV